MANTACLANSTSCNLFSNMIISAGVKTPPSNYTGLAAVIVDNAQDWRVFYHDANGMVSQLVGKNSGFDDGQIIGGMALNASSIAATNINMTTNNINVFYVDASTTDLYTLEFTGDWTIRELSPRPKHTYGRCGALLIFLFYSSGVRYSGNKLVELSFEHHRMLQQNSKPDSRLLHWPRQEHIRISWEQRFFNSYLLDFTA